MGKDVKFKNHDRFVHLGIFISELRKARGMSQEQLAEKAYISRSHLSVIESDGNASGFDLEVVYDIADALGVKASLLIDESEKPL